MNCEHRNVCRYAGGAHSLQDALNKIPIDIFGENFTAEIKCKYFKKDYGPVVSGCSTRTVED